MLCLRLDLCCVQNPFDWDSTQDLWKLQHWWWQEQAEWSQTLQGGTRSERTSMASAKLRGIPAAAPAQSVVSSAQLLWSLADQDGGREAKHRGSFGKNPKLMRYYLSLLGAF